MLENKIPFNKAHQSWMLAKITELIFPDGKLKINTTLPEAVYLKAAKILKESGSIKKIPPYSSFFKQVVGNAEK
jgi:hypothetical protein